MAEPQADAQLQEAAFKKLYSEEYYDRCDLTCISVIVYSLIYT
jgi:hypothetical protein